MTVLAIYNMKGGVGKTAAAVNLSYISASEGNRTLLWDLDPQGAAGFYFQVATATKNEARKVLNHEMNLGDVIQDSGYENLSIIPSDLSARNADVVLTELKQGKRHIKSALSSIKNDYDIVLLDCPPGLSVLHDNIFAAADWVLMPNIPTTLSVRSYEILLEHFRESGLGEEKIKAFFSMVDHRKNLHHEIINQFHRNKAFFKKYIPYLSDVEKMGQQLAPVETYARSSYAAQSFRDLWKEIRKSSLS